MRSPIFTGIAGLAVLAGLATLMFTTAASARPAAASTAVRVTVAMHDPGCHWFVSGPSNHRRWTLTRTVIGPVAFRNFDEAALIIRGPNGTVRERVGASILLKAKGLYRITMVRQASDDNHLRLTIK